RRVTLSAAAATRAAAAGAATGEEGAASAAGSQLRAGAESTPEAPRMVVDGGRPDGQTGFAGHGEHSLCSGSFTVPEGTEVAVYARYGSALSDVQGYAVESGSASMNPLRTYRAGESMPNFTLKPPSGLRIRAGSVTVKLGIDSP